MSDNPFTDKPAPPGICDECAVATALFIVGSAVTVHCWHNETGAIGHIQGGEYNWYAWRPITRETFEAMAARAIHDAHTAAGDASGAY